jgi:hypothetical protein
VVSKILEDMILQSARFFFNNIGMKGPRSKCNKKEEKGLLDIYRFIIEYLRRLDIVFTDFKRAEVTIAGEKNKFYIAGLKIVGYIYNINSRYLD